MSLAERVWKYTALGASSIIGEETNPIIGGIAARHGRLDFLAVVVSVALGTWLASIALYYIGLWKIDWVRARWPQKRRALDGALEIVHRHPWRASLAVRFAYGLRLPLPIACGAARLPISLYVVATGVSCWLWAFAFAYLGLVAGGAALALLAFTHRLEVRLGLLAVVLLAVLFFFLRRRRIAERTARVLAGEDIPIMTTAERSAIP
jgi:membrane protein DedA with SNARE-associated domain